MPPITEEYQETAETIKTSFLGDPSFFAYNGEEAGEEDPEAPPVERFREIHRLTQTVLKIDHDCSLVPRGALCVDGTKKVIPTGSSYQGLSYQTSLELRAYLHMRPPENLQCIALLKRPGIIKTDDFLDCIDKDTPKGRRYIRYIYVPLDICCGIPVYTHSRVYPLYRLHPLSFLSPILRTLLTSTSHLHHRNVEHFA